MKMLLLRLLLAGLVAFTGASAAQAQAPRTWVSGVGDDVNPCSRTAPCKTFAGAFTRTAPGGEINCLDPGGYGAVTITRSLTILCDYTEGGIAAALVNGVIVNAGASDVIVLSGLDIQGFGTGLSGVRFLAGAALHIRNSTISGFRSSPATGVAFRPSGSSELFLDRVRISENGVAGAGGGVVVQPTGAAGSARVSIQESDVSNNTGPGISVDVTGNTGPSTAMNVTRTRMAGNGTGLSVNAPAGTTGITVSIADSIVFNNGTGLAATGGTTQVAIADSTIASNTNELSLTTGGVVQSFGNNRRVGNVVPGTYTPPTLTGG